jgi:hypothetical protein
MTLKTVFAISDNSRINTTYLQLNAAGTDLQPAASYVANTKEEPYANGICYNYVQNGVDRRHQFIADMTKVVAGIKPTVADIAADQGVCLFYNAANHNKVDSIRVSQNALGTVITEGASTPVEGVALYAIYDTGKMNSVDAALPNIEFTYDSDEKLTGFTFDDANTSLEIQKLSFDDHGDFCLFTDKSYQNIILVIVNDGSGALASGKAYVEMIAGAFPATEM